MPPDAPALRPFMASAPQIRFLDVAVHDLNGQWRGKRLPVEALDKLLAGEIKLPISTVVMDVWGHDVMGSGLPEAGDVDGICLPIDRAPLVDPARPDIARVPVQIHPTEGGDFGGDGRQVLGRAVDALAAMGLRAVVASELEFYLLRRGSAADGVPKPITTPEPRVYDLGDLDLIDGMLHQVRAQCEQQGIPLDTMLAEYGPGQYELTLRHRADALAAADDAVRLRWIIRTAAAAAGYEACFMPKLWAGQAGSGQHVHVSLVDAAGANVFDDGTQAGTPRLREAVAGLMETLPAAMLSLAPSRTGYRRLAESAFQVPSRVCWGYDSRFVPLRVPSGPPAARRVEHRVAGAEANPYLVIAVVLAGIIHGLREHLTAPPPCASTQAAHDPALVALPNTWAAAIAAFDQPGPLSRILGEDFRRHFTATKRQELQRFEEQISSFEFQSYVGVG